jgi:hypothetical protein
LECPRWFVDFEASGIAPDSYPIEIAVVAADFEYQALILPVYHWTHWSWDAQDMHGISRENLFANGLEPSLIAVELNSTFAGARLCSDSPQDGFWLDTLYEAAGIQPSFELLPIEDFVGRSGASEVYRLLPNRHVHRALPDARALMTATLKYLGKVSTPLPIDR